MRIGSLLCKTSLLLSPGMRCGLSWRGLPVKIITSLELSGSSRTNKMNMVLSFATRRLVAQGYSQVEGLYFDETFAPVARLESICMFIAYATFNGFPLFQMDVKS